ncbi:tol-pal system protein YbgF [Alsobacter soli]|uniref:Cell division coordinator CpoB n=1 Tax=Alsobacter soli TaxID=2109933 RepID=A0A2T1HZ31_9HYPH|nr:tol-pal system protein YbgF [Alsobacter soli]PSC06953.1 tol-pal system protein YbgF [Alsobacter soli]
MIRRFAWALAAIALLGALAPAAQAQEVSDLVVRTNRLEGQVRQLSGQIEQLQFENRRLQDQLKKFQEDVEFRFGEMKGGAGGGRPAATGVTPQAAPPRGQKRGDAFDPAAQPGAPGAPRTLGSLENDGSAAAQPRAPQGSGHQRGIADLIEDDPSAPMDLNSMNRNVAGLPQGALPPGGTQAYPAQQQAYPQGGYPQAGYPQQQAAPGMPRGAYPSQTGTTVATAGTGLPKDEYDLAYGLVLQRQYEQAEQAFKQFLQTHPRDKLAANATYWLGETYYRRGQYPDAVEQYLKVYKHYNSSGVAPESMLKLGLALRGMGQPDQACATLAEVARRYPNASGDVRANADRELKRGNCTN